MKLFFKLSAVLTAVLCIAGCSKKSAQAASDETVSSEPAVEISFGDYDAMNAFSKKMQNGEFKEGQSVIIDGEISVFMSASIGQRKDGTFIGTTLEIEDIESDDYPEDGSRIKVNAKVKKNKEYGFSLLAAKSSDVTVLEDAAEIDDEE